MRGTPCVQSHVDFVTGIIPAYAGNTHSVVNTPDYSGDHPRVCGEHPIATSVRSITLGSSPRMRGTPRIPRPVERGTGIIPAYAGNTRGVLCYYRGDGDHPRVCGEHVPVRGLARSIAGSSPRMRGTHVGDFLGGQVNGIIPAYAGNTGRRELARPALRDHPRVCGEHFPDDQIGRWNLGSSPRMRGTHGLNVQGSTFDGIIPAYAGNTFAHPFVAALRGDHPRVCGEHFRQLSAAQKRAGSSPRMRGTRWR